LSRYGITCAKVFNIKFILSNFFIIFFNPAFRGFSCRRITKSTEFYCRPLGNYFISNSNGSLLSRDNNGSIIKLNSSGKSLLWIREGSPQIRLNTPDGLAIQGNHLYFTDIGSIHSFNKNSVKPLGNIDFTGIGVKRLRYSAFDDESNLYISDVLANAIYKIETGNDQKILFSKKAIV
jgi:hypothetical protein